MSVFGFVVGRPMFSVSFLVFAYQNATKFGAFSQICRTEEIGPKLLLHLKSRKNNADTHHPHKKLGKEFGEGVALRSSVFSVSVYFTNLW